MPDTESIFLMVVQSIVLATGLSLWILFPTSQGEGQEFESPSLQNLGIELNSFFCLIQQFFRSIGECLWLWR